MGPGPCLLAHRYIPKRMPHERGTPRLLSLVVAGICEKLFPWCHVTGAQVHPGAAAARARHAAAAVPGGSYLIRRRWYIPERLLHARGTPRPLSLVGLI